MLITILFYFVLRSSVEAKLDIEGSGVVFSVSLSEQTEKPVRKM